jgi:hypothetical protein
MTPAAFRKLALALPEAQESSHMGAPDFRIGGKIFATLAGGKEWGMVKLSLTDQTHYAREAPAIFEIFPNAWGRAGCTKVLLGEVKKPHVALIQQALYAAWKNTAPKKMLKALEEE